LEHARVGRAPLKIGCPCRPRSRLHCSRGRAGSRGAVALPAPIEGHGCARQSHDAFEALIADTLGASAAKSYRVAAVEHGARAVRRGAAWRALAARRRGLAPVTPMAAARARK